MARDLPEPRPRPLSLMFLDLLAGGFMATHSPAQIPSYFLPMRAGYISSLFLVSFPDPSPCAARGHFLAYRTRAEQLKGGGGVSGDETVHFGARLVYNRDVGDPVRTGELLTCSNRDSKCIEGGQP